jgi:deoxyribonuclease-4
MELSKLYFTDYDYKYGFHVIKSPSMLKTILRVIKETNLTAIQVYVSSPKSKAPPVFDYEDLLAARKVAISNRLHVAIHGCLLYNLAGAVDGRNDPEFDKKLSSTLRGLIGELDFGTMLNSGVVVHPGSQKNTKEGLLEIAKSIEYVLTTKTLESEKIAKILNISVKEVIASRKIILENAAGEGTKLCSTLEEIAEVINNVKKELRPQIKVCIDTAHGYGRGIYDWGLKGEMAKFYKDFDKIIGLEYLEMFHFNDSMRGEKKAENAFFGGRKDRHQQLGEGYIFDKNDPERYDQIRVFMLEARKRKIVVISEPPVSGILDYEVVVNLLKGTKYPLVEVEILTICKFKEVGLVRVGRIVNGKNPSFEGFLPIIVLTASSAYGELGPYVLKDENNFIMENIWQFSKCYKKVAKSRQTYSRWDNTVIWEWPEEIHIDEVTQEPNEKYWKWRKTGMENSYAVRWPVGKECSKLCLYSLISKNGEKLDYVSARKQIYAKVYNNLVKKEKTFCKLQKMLFEGKNLLIIEVDGPHMESLDYYKKTFSVNDDFIENDTILATHDNLKIMLDDVKFPYGHGYCLASCLLNIENKLYI